MVFIHTHTHNMHEHRHGKTLLLNRIMKDFNKCYFEPHLGYDKTHAEFNSQKANNLCFFFLLNFIQKKNKRGERQPRKSTQPLSCSRANSYHKKQHPPTFISPLPLYMQRISHEESSIVLFCQGIAISGAHQACFQCFCVFQGACN